MDGCILVFKHSGLPSQRSNGYNIIKVIGENGVEVGRGGGGGGGFLLVSTIKVLSIYPAKPMTMSVSNSLVRANVTFQPTP